METRSLLSVVYLFLSLTGGTPRKLVRHHRSGVQKKQNDTRQSSNGLQSRSPPTNVITELQTSLDLRKIILTGNNPDGPSSCCCEFLVVFSLPVSSAVRCRVLWVTATQSSGMPSSVYRAGASLGMTFSGRICGKKSRCV